MGSKEQFLEMQEDLMARVDVPYPIYMQLRHELYPDEDNIELRTLHSPSLREEYKKHPGWVALTKTIKECMQDREEIESEIRVELQLKNYSVFARHFMQTIYSLTSTIK